MFSPHPKLGFGARICRAKAWYFLLFFTGLKADAFTEGVSHLLSLKDKNLPIQGRLFSLHPV